MATKTPTKQPPQLRQLRDEVDATIKRLEAKDPGLKRMLKEAYGYAVFPSVGKAALVVGGSYGRGLVFERDKPIGFATIGQTTIGVQVGGITFTEIVLFENRQALNRFKEGKVKFAANAAAVLVKAGAAGTANYEKGVKALAYSKGGMLLEASIGGQKFNFKPASGDATGAKGKSGKGGAGERGAGSGGDDDADTDEGGATGLAGRAVDGVRGAASGATDLVKRHPWAATVVGTGLVAGAALMAMRALRSGSDSEDETDQESDADDEDSDDQDDEDSADSRDADAEEDSGEDDEDEGEEQEDEDRGSEDEGEEEETPRHRARSKSRR